MINELKQGQRVRFNKRCACLCDPEDTVFRGAVGTVNLRGKWAFVNVDGVFYEQGRIYVSYEGADITAFVKVIDEHPTDVKIKELEEKLEELKATRESER